MESTSRPRVAFVVQRYGTEVNGGAEVLCRQVAEHLAPLWDLEVLTSCSRDYVSRFENEYPPGLASVNGIAVRRFAVDHRRSEGPQFAALDTKVRSRLSSPAEENLWLREIGPHCSQLSTWLTEHAPAHDLIVFFTYLYWTTSALLPLVKSKAVLVPLAHDEPPMVARPFDGLFALPRAVLCNTPEEEAFLRKRTGGRLAPTQIVGAGVDAAAPADPALFRAHAGLPGQYVLYLGRIQKEKGCDSLFRLYLGLPEKLKALLPLVLIGKAAMEIPASPHIRHAGFVSEELKRSALAGATLLLMPSPYESLSLVTLEAWMSGVPVLVNGDCEILKGQCRRSQGGLWYQSADEFREAFTYLVAPEQAGLRKGLAANGKRYVEQSSRWGTIVDKYQRVLDLVRTANAGS